MGKPAFCIYENKGAVQLHGNRAADQRLCLSYMISTIPLFLKETPITKVITCMKIYLKIKNGIFVKDIDTSGYIVE